MTGAASGLVLLQHFELVGPWVRKLRYGVEILRGRAAALWCGLEGLHTGNHAGGISATGTALGLCCSRNVGLFWRF